MAWDDVVFGTLTGGLYNLGKTAYKAGKAADQAGDAVEEIADSVGEALSIMGETFTELADDLGSFINELEDLLTTERVVPRSDDELWDEELTRLNLLRQMQAELTEELASFGEIQAPATWWDWLSFDWGEYKEYMKVLGRLNVVNTAIREILYQEPGVIPAAIYDFKEVLARFNTMEQPRIEAIMDATEDSMETAGDILAEVHKLFVVTRWKPAGDLSPAQQGELDRLEAAKSVYDVLIDRNLHIAEQLRGPLVRVHPEEFMLPAAAPRAWKADIIASTAAGTARDTGAVHKPVAPGIPAAEASAGAVERGLAAKAGISTNKPAPVLHAPLLAGIVKEKALVTRPVAETLGFLTRNAEISAYLGSHTTVTGRIRYLERERHKIERAIARIRWVKVEEPGVIPLALDEVHRTIARFRAEEQPRLETTMDSVNAALARFTAEEQPRIEMILDSVNETVSESQKLLENVNESLDKSQGWLDFLAAYRTPILVICGIGGVLAFAIMAALLVVLVKLAITL
ncbi:MAG TPA: hypothetical protein ENN85_06200 [Methanoculleus sp.]|nr:hypothetical protein [Methanoculleus sp.]